MTVVLCLEESGLMECNAAMTDADVGVSES